MTSSSLRRIGRLDQVRIETRLRRLALVLRLPPTRERHDPDIRTALPANAATRLVAVHAGHTDVEHDDRCAKIRQRCEPRFAVVRHPHGAAHALDEEGHGIGGVAVIVDHEHPGIRERRIAGRRSHGPQRRRTGDSDSNRELAAAAQAFATRLDAPAVQVHESPRQREADAEPRLAPLARRVRLHEQLEHSRQHLFGNTDARIGHFENQLRMPRLGRPLDPAADRNAPATRREFRGVLEHVRYHLREACRIHVEHSERLREIHDELESLGADGGAIRLDRASHDARECHRLAL